MEQIKIVEKERRNNYKKSKSSRFPLKDTWVILAAFALMFAYLFQLDSMVGMSADAASIWETIKTFRTEDITPSYVLYKGFSSIYPYVWLYDLSRVFGTGEFFFIKIYHCILFAYISGAALPYTISRIANIELKNYRRLILVVILFYLWSFNLSFSQIMIDLPSLAFFLLLVNSALRIESGNKNVWKYIYSGLLAGLCTCLSGQYSLPAVFVILFILLKSFGKKVIRKKKNVIIMCLYIILMFASIMSVRIINYGFENTVTNEFREEGESIPTGGEWLSIGYLRLIDNLRVSPAIDIPDNRGLAIIKDVFESENFEETHEIIELGGMAYSMVDYFKLVLKYPGDFVLRYFNRLFLSLTEDGGYFKFLPLFISSTLTFMTGYVVTKKVKAVGGLFSSKTLLIMAFVSAIIPSIILVIEPRGLMQIQGLVFGTAILCDELWNSLKVFKNMVKEIITTKSVKCLMDKKIPYIFLLYIIFVCFCFMHMGSLYELNGSNPGSVLIDFGF